MKPMGQKVRAQLELTALKLRSARSVLFITGGGVSAECGVPVHTGYGGLYEGRTSEDGLSIDQELSLDMWKRKPEVTWGHLALIGACASVAGPSAAHRVIGMVQKLRTQVEAGLTHVATTNVDGLHYIAGTRGTIELCGSVFRFQCDKCGLRDGKFMGKEWSRYPSTSGRVTADDDGPAKIGWAGAKRLVRTLTPVAATPPECPQCGAAPGALRPQVRLPGEPCPVPHLLGKVNSIVPSPDLIITVGVSGRVPAVVDLVGKCRARKKGDPVWPSEEKDVDHSERLLDNGLAVDINLTETPVSRAASMHIRQGAAPALTHVRELLLEHEDEFHVNRVISNTADTGAWKERSKTDVKPRMPDEKHDPPPWAYPTRPPEEDLLPPAIIKKTVPRPSQDGHEWHLVNRARSFR